MTEKNDKYEKPEKAKDKWDGAERRVSGVADRRGAAAPKPFEEYPKMVEGVTYQTADAEKAGAKATADAEKAAAKEKK